MKVLLLFLLIWCYSGASKVSHRCNQDVSIVKLGHLFLKDTTGVTSFKTSGDGPAGDVNLLTNPGSNRGQFIASGFVTGHVAGNITHGYIDTHAYVIGDRWVEHKFELYQWTDGTYAYDIQVNGYANFKSELLLEVFDTGVVNDEDIYFTLTGKFTTDNPELSYFNNRIVILKYLSQTIDFQTFTIDAECILYAVLDPSDTWDIDEAPPKIFGDDDDDDDCDDH